MSSLKLFLLALAVSSSLFMSSCGKEDPLEPALSAGGMNFWKITSAVVVVNPVINEGSSTGIPSGTIREGVEKVKNNYRYGKDIYHRLSRWTRTVNGNFTDTAGT